MHRATTHSYYHTARKTHQPRRQALRTCPLCRQPTHFVTPSAAWPDTPEEKAAVVAAYRAKLAAIDCMHFGFGDGDCPFGTSCFYRHAFRDGRLAVRGGG